MYKYVKKAPRKVAERKQLPGYHCPMCKKYYDTLNLKPDELAKRLKLVSRHRTDPGPPSPEGFWDLEFPEIEEEDPKPHYFKPISENRYL